MTAIERPPTSLGDIDEESVALILELQRQDGELLGSAAKGKQLEGSALSDSEMALNLHLEELSMASVSFSDHKIAKSIQTAIREDADTLKKLSDEELMATQDRNLSLELSGNPASKSEDVGAAPPEGVGIVEDGDAELIEKMTCIYVTGEHDGLQKGSVAGQEAEGSAWAASRPHRPRECISCGDRYHFTDVSRAPCQHEYCRQCLRQLFEGSMLDESMFPPRCCKRPLPLDKNLLFLPEEVVKTFREKAVEFSTPNRTYCHRTECLAFIPPSRYVNGVAHCRDCAASTCVSCKGISHKGDCPHDESLQQVIDLARSEGWQRCQNCWTMVELGTGCYHMTCRCGSQFCYLCGTPYVLNYRGILAKQCHCAEWDEHRLLERAEEIDGRDHVDQVLVDDVAVANAHAERINRIMQNLRENHECDHLRWRGRPGPRECEECGDEMPLFIYECRQCNIMACRRCRYNRL
ncbi:uncharacterized protein PG998_003886 [Apiospora kogelbergensis]|uniref:uncharacterized protein n=1 Tax=Apiospora kogelbergensis TaxID=1337665 RepID=UPI0031317277